MSDERYHKPDCESLTCLRCLPPVAVLKDPAYIALLAENEALKKNYKWAIDDRAKLFPVLNADSDMVGSSGNETVCETAARVLAALRAKLSLYTSWQPSDPGTKEAMECAGSSWEYKSADIARIAVSLGVLATSYRAAMVRLEEAEKGRDAFKHALSVEIRGEHAEECDCLDHRRAAEKLLSDFKSFDSYIDNLYIVGVYKSKVAALTASLASMTKGRDEEKSQRYKEAMKGYEWSQKFHAAEARAETMRESLELEQSRRQSAEAKVADQSNVIIELGAKLNATKLREEGLEAKVAALEKDGCCCDADGHVCAQAEKLEKVRKRMGEAERIIRGFLAITPCNHIGTDYDCESNEAKRFLASPPSPAPPKDCPRVIGGMICQRTVGHDGDHWLTPAPGETP